MKSFRGQIYSFFLLILSLFVFNSCGPSNSLKVDVSDVDVNLEVKRFEKDLIALDSPLKAEAINSLIDQYPEFYPIYMQRIMGFGSVEDSSYYKILSDFLTNEDINTLFEDTDSIFADFNPAKAELEKAFKHVKYYYPEYEVPAITTFISGFQYQVIMLENSMALGLDLFLGANYQYYGTTNLPQYIIRKLIPEQITTKVITSLVADMYPERTVDNFAQRMIVEGKRMCFLDAMLPETHDTLKMGYTLPQLEWASKNEEQIWRYLIDKELLYGNANLDFAKYFEEAPFTNSIGTDSSPKLGIYIGWQIVRKYKSENPSLTLGELMKETDYQKILKKSGYRP
jgi:hypothetical protein